MDIKERTFASYAERRRYEHNRGLSEHWQFNLVSGLLKRGLVERIRIRQNGNRTIIYVRF